MKYITTTELKKRLDEKDILLIDVREPAEYNIEYIQEAELIPLNQISVEKLSSTSKPIAIHCRSGKRSQAACQKLLKQKPDLELYSLEGGIEAWRNAGLKTQKIKTNILSVERQMQITLGIMIISFTAFGILYDSVWHFLTGFLGAGLIFAGVSGWCGMMKLINLMPWNR